jgi:hypothetical protein
LYESTKKIKRILFKETVYVVHMTDL